MKTKIGELYNKPIVIGNPNEFTKNEIPLSELKGGSDDSFDDGVFSYYKVLNYKIEGDNLPFTDLRDAPLKPYSVIIDGILNIYPPDGLIGAFCVLNVAPYYDYISLQETSIKEQIETNLLSWGTSLEDSSRFKRITAKEYYSLLK